MKRFVDRTRASVSGTACRKKICFLVFLMAAMAAAGKTANTRAATATSAPLLDMSMQLNVYSIDLKTESLYSQYYHFQMWALDPTVSSFDVVILRPDYYGGVNIMSQNVSRVQEAIETMNSDNPSINAWRFHLTPHYFLLGGLPGDTYDLSFLIALNMSTQLNTNETTIWMPAYLQDQWSYSEDIAAQRIAQPSNQTLVSLGLSPLKFYQYRCNTMTDFYLVTVSLSFPLMNSFRMMVAFLLPSLAILSILIVASVYRRRIGRTDFLAIFVGAGLFTLSFLVSFYQYAPPDVFTWEELLLIIDFVFASGLAVYSIVRRKKAKPKEEATTQTQNPAEKPQEQDPQLVKIGKSLDKAFEWFVLLMSVLIGVLFAFLTWITKPESNLDLTSKFLFSLTAPLVLAICTWLWGLMTLRKDQEIFLRLSSWGIVSMVFAYYIMLFTTFVVLGISRQFEFAAAVVLLVGSAIVGLFPLKRITGAYKAATPENDFWNRKYAFAMAYVLGAAIAGFLILIPFVFS